MNVVAQTIGLRLRQFRTTNTSIFRESFIHRVLYILLYIDVPPMQYLVRKTWQ